VKRKELLQHLEKSGCILLREGKRHSVYINPEKNLISTVPRHREIDNKLARKICRDLGIAPLSTGHKDNKNPT